MRNLADDFEVRHIRREFKRGKETHDAPDSTLHQEFIYDEGGIKIGATSRIRQLKFSDFTGYDPRNHIGSAL